MRKRTVKPQSHRRVLSMGRMACDTMGAAIGIFRDFRNVALGLTIVNVVALYGAALAYPVNRGAVAPFAMDVPEFAGPAAIKDFVSQPPRFVAVTTARLQAAMDEADFRLDRVRGGRAPVPRLFLAAMPRDFRTVGDTATRKALFMQASLPLILRANEEILANRRHLEELYNRVRQGRSLAAADAYWLAALAQQYGTAADDFAGLLVRVDAISPAVAMAQAALESGWGQSRFAMEGNALFGQRTWRRGAGIVPSGRAAGSSFEVKYFDRLIDSVRDYALNLNRHPAYVGFRAKRAAMRAANGPFDSYELAVGLDAYSERGADYVDMLQLIMRANAMERFDTALLDGVDGVTQLAGR